METDGAGAVAVSETGRPDSQLNTKRAEEKHTYFINSPPSVPRPFPLHASPKSTTELTQQRH